MLFAILQKYDFSSKSQHVSDIAYDDNSCLRYCKSTIFQANHNSSEDMMYCAALFAILQKYDFSSKSQHPAALLIVRACCLRYCKSTIFQANHNVMHLDKLVITVVCDTAKVRFFKQITTALHLGLANKGCLRYCKSTIFQANHNILVSLVLSALLFAILQKYDFSSKSQR